MRKMAKKNKQSNGTTETDENGVVIKDEQKNQEENGSDCAAMDEAETNKEEDNAVNSDNESKGSNDEEAKEIQKSGSKKRKSSSKSPAKKKNKKSKTVKPKADSDEIEDDESPKEFEVDKIIAMKEKSGKRQFKIRWKGYGEDGDTWEDEADLNCPEAIKAYLDNQAGPASKIKGKSPLKKSINKQKQTPKKKKVSEAEEEEEEEDEAEEKEKEYEVEKIIEVHNKKNGKHEFLVRWKGYTTKDDTWEPEEHLNCPDLISKFMAKVEKAKEVPERDLRIAPTHTKRFTLAQDQHGRRLSKRKTGQQRAKYHEQE